jgi:trimeric autotransporter adhesin
MKTTTVPLTNSINRSPLRAFLLIPLVLAYFALWPTARAVSPPPDGGYDGQNTAEGDDALINLNPPIFGTDNTAIGFEALFSSTNSFFNTAIGSQALSSAITSEANTAVGYKALVENTTGGFNTATGQQALGSNTTGFFNTAIGSGALFGNTNGGSNTASGGDALASNTTGVNNTASGVSALQNNTTGNDNTANGVNALYSNATGSHNIALGFKAGLHLTTGNRNIDIGNTGVAGESSTIRIGSVGDQTAAFIAGISGATVPTGVPVIVDTSGHLGTTTSSVRFKEAIEPMDKASEAIFALKPVSFRYKHELDPDGIRQFGLVAEDVEKVNPALVARDEQGKPYTVRYEAVNAMLLSEFLKEHRTVQELKAAAAKQEATITRQQKQIDALRAGLQDASAQLGLSKAAPRTVLNNQ